VVEAKEEAALLLSHFAGVSRATLLCDRERVFAAPGLDEAVRRRLSRYPLQYILGSWDFFGLPFRVDEHCLIPRPDTEILVEQAIRRIPQGVPVADLCTGSGCIAVSLLSARPDLRCAALEVYPDTLRLACENARTCGVEDRFIPVLADLLNGGRSRLQTVLPACGSGEAACFGALLSNPPYIRRADLDGLSPELAFEPQAALDGGEDGLRFYRAILTEYRPLLAQGGLLFLEIGWDQAKDIRDLAQAAGGWSDPTIIQDLGGRNRVVILTAVGNPDGGTQN
jgi:release factor glutamine methyltransferase